MSTVAFGPAVAISAIAASPLLLPLVAGVAAWGVISSCINAKTALENEAEKNRRSEEERKNYLLSINSKISNEMTSLINAVSDANERKSLLSQLNTISKGIQADIENYREIAPDAAFREIRQKILSVQVDENIAKSQYDELKMIESLLSGKIPPGFVPEWNEIQTELQKTNALTLQNKVKSLTALLGRTRVFAEKVTNATKISLPGLVEEKYTIPIMVLPSENKTDVKSKKFMSLLADIADFGARVAFLDESEARKLRPLMDEAAEEKTRADEFRLTAIRQEIKMRYGKLKEQKVLTELFKEELRDMLPLVKRARGAETLIVRMEELLTAREIPRARFMPLYEDIKILLTDQLERITDEAVAEKVGGVLNEMGYTLVGEDGESLSVLPAREVNYIESPYEGYQVKVKVDKGGKLSTRLVRVVAGEEEKNSASEYQRQKDIEIGRKWCKDLDAFHERMKSEGIEFRTTLRKEPEEEPLDVVVKTAVATKKKRAGTAAANAQKRLAR